MYFNKKLQWAYKLVFTSDELMPVWVYNLLATLSGTDHWNRKKSLDKFAINIFSTQVLNLSCYVLNLSCYVAENVNEISTTRINNNRWLCYTMC